jgi:periplasmic divalent cation tolerance protein
MPTAYITAPRKAASDLAEFLVEAELAACVNVVDCDSYYRWDGDVYAGSEESILFVKTTKARYPELKAAVEDEHPFDVPCIELFDEIDVLDSYGDWIDEEVK